MAVSMIKRVRVSDIPPVLGRAVKLSDGRYGVARAAYYGAHRFAGQIEVEYADDETSDADGGMFAGLYRFGEVSPVINGVPGWNFPGGDAHYEPMIG